MIENEKMIERPTQAEAGYVTLSTEPGKACASCRWFAKDQGGYCHLIELYPQDILPTGYCERHEAIPAEAPVEAITQDAVAVVADAILQAGEMVNSAMDKSVDEPEPHTHPEPDYGYIAPDSNAENVFKGLVEKFKRGMKPGLSVMKGVDGKRYMLIVTSNSYEDREQETITTEGLKAWVDTCWKAVEGEFATDNPLVYWHDMRVKMGDIVWADVRGPFLVEFAREADGLLSQTMFDYVEAHPEEKWGASHKFAYYKAHKDADGTYHRIIKKETTVLPRSAAANALTFSGVIPMADKRSEFLNKMLGLDNAAELLDKGIEPLVAELKKRGVEHKSTDGETPADNENVYANLLADMIKAQADMDAQLEETQVAGKAAEDRIKALEDELVTVKTENKQLVERVDIAEKSLDARPRIASRAQETEIEPNQLSKELRDSLKKKDAFWGTEVFEG